MQSIPDSILRSWISSGDAVVDQNDHDSWVEVTGVLPGDANFDGMVSFVDFLSLSAHFGDDGGWGEGDFDGSGRVDFGDFLVMSENFGGQTIASVPEPASWRLGILAILGVLGVRCIGQPPTRLD